MGAAAGLSVAAMLERRISAAEKAAGVAKGKIRHSVCKWCYPKIPLEDLCAAAKDIGLESIEMLDPPDFQTMKKYGLHCAMVSYPTAPGPDGRKIGSAANFPLSRLTWRSVPTWSRTKATPPLIATSTRAPLGGISDVAMRP